MSQKIEHEVYTVFDGLKGWEYNGKIYRLAVGGQTIVAPNGDLICSWMSGGDTEPADDHIVLYSRSTDGGRTWGDIDVLLDQKEGEDNGSANTFNINDRIFCMCARWPAGDRYDVWHYTRKESHDNGHTWVDEVPITLYEGERLSSSFGNIITLQNGELLGCGTFMQKREKPLTAGVNRLVHAKSEEEAAAMEPMMEGEDEPIDFGRTQYGMFCFKPNADMTEFEIRGRVGNRPLGLLEGNIIQHKDGHLMMIMRAEWGGFLWRADSYDEGYTWTDARPTDIPNPSALAQVLRLPDGRIALFHNPTGGVVGKRGARDIVSVWVSDDEMETWYLKEDLLFGGYLSYPCPILMKDGSIGFGYDKNRRGVEFVRVTIPPIEK
ncbi:MAG: exo-alpha-sialidase [Clostridia bacterium]|nr:exo-alpha-sialidase [Clostridia bacterium]